MTRNKFLLPLFFEINKNNENADIFVNLSIIFYTR